MFVYTSIAYIFPLQSNEIFKSDTRSPVLSRKSFVCTTSVPSHACSSNVPPILDKNTHNCFIRCNSGSSSSSNVESIGKPAYSVVSSSDSIINVSKSVKYIVTHSDSLDFSTSTFRVVSHRDIRRKRKLRTNVINSSLVNSTNSHDILI